MPLLPAALPRLIALLVLAVPVAATPSGPMLLDAARAGDVIVAVGEEGLVLRLPEPDAEWSRSTAGSGATLTGIDFVNDTLGWAVGHDGVVVVTRDSGETWSAARTPREGDDSYLDVLALSEKHIIAVGGFGAYLESRDSGETWRRRRIVDEPVHLNRLARTGDGTLYIAGDEGLLLRSTNNGRRWEPVETGNEHAFHGVLPLHDGTLVAYGLRGRIYRSTDEGDTWQRMATRGEALLLTGIELPDGTLVLAGQPRLCLVSRDGGVSFSRASHDIPAISALVLRGERELLSFGDGGVHLLQVP